MPQQEAQMGVQNPTGGRNRQLCHTLTLDPVHSFQPLPQHLPRMTTVYSIR